MDGCFGKTQPSHFSISSRCAKNSIRTMVMERKQEEMQFLGVFGIYQEAYKIIFSSRKIFSQITLAFILPLLFILLAQIEVPNVLFGKIINNELELQGTEAGTKRYNKLSDHIFSELAYFWLFKVACLILSVVFSLLSNAAVVYTIASIYAGREVSFKKVMSAVPKICKRLMVTFLSIYVALLAYIAVTILVFSLVFLAWFIFIGFSNLKVLYPFGIVLLVLSFMGCVYLTIIWLLASVVSVLEQDWGFKAMTKSKALIKGKMWTATIIYFNISITSATVTMAFQNIVVHGGSMNMAGRVLLGVICSSLILGVCLFGYVTYAVIYFVCKSNHHENIEKSALSDHLEAYHGEYVPLKSKDHQFENLSMVQGRGSADLVVVNMAALLCLIVLTGHVHAATYTVGGSGGWTLNVDSWPKGKRFKAGDTLVFTYDPTIHDVVAVNRGGYSSCITPEGARVYKSGKDQIKLSKGQNFFICNVAGHCESGMKIAINAA
ncbi:hypothetical protein SADUNF_Sadunf02G0061600 [Salix dunnii]|uniref:Basic blue protein n=1 Tax=Salix dunnii TaxID=1413687 RepID=A0A835N6F1_9ROSI|nr:hypothetical protein SADUNF_Sadunf02G0061600 [Salix dunnii]